MPRLQTAPVQGLTPGVGARLPDSSRPTGRWGGGGGDKPSEANSGFKHCNEASHFPDLSVKILKANQEILWLISNSDKSAPKVGTQAPFFFF